MRLILCISVVCLILGTFTVCSAQEPSFDELNVFGGETVENTAVAGESNHADESSVPTNESAVHTSINLLGLTVPDVSTDIVRQTSENTSENIDEDTTDSESESEEREEESPGYVGIPTDGHTQFNQYEVCTDNRNACGTTSLSMILADQGLLEKDLKAAQELDQYVRPWGGFSAPYDLRRYARWNGLYSASWNEATFQDLEDRLAKGNSVQCMISGGSSPHWIYVMGVETDPNTGEKTVIIADPGDHSTSRMSQKKFEEKWKEPNTGMAGSFINDTFGYKNYMIVYDKDMKDVPLFSKNFGIASAENIGDGITDICNFPSHIGKGRVGTGVGHLLGGTVRVISSLPGAIGSVFETAGDKTLDWSGEKWDEGGFGNKVLAGVGYVVGGTVKAAGAVTKFAGNVVSVVGEGVGSTIETIGEATDKAASKVWGWITGK